MLSWLMRHACRPCRALCQVGGLRQSGWVFACLANFLFQPCPPAAEDKLQREVERLKEHASTLLHRMRYMKTRVSEAEQLQHGTGDPEPAQHHHHHQQQQQQQQQDAIARGEASTSGAATTEA